jgi:hypothetical protein
MATNNAVIILREEEILIWAIPPLSPQPPDFFDHNPTFIPPLFIIPLSDNIGPDSEYIRWNTISSWYFGSSQPLYCDMLCEDCTLHRFEIMLEPDLSTASLHVINTSEITPHDFGGVYLPEYMICGDTLVSWYMDSNYNPESLGDQYQGGIYTRLTTAACQCFANGIISHGGPAANMLLPDIGHEYDLFLCPASGRFVRVDFGASDSDSTSSIAILDFF